MPKMMISLHSIIFSYTTERQYQRQSVEILLKIGLNSLDVDTCLFWKQYEKETILWPYIWTTT